MVWLSLAAIYMLFLFWYQGVGKKISPDEVDGIMEKIEQQFREQDSVDDDLLSSVRKFISEDDGKDFVMINLVELNEPKKESEKILKSYVMPFLRELFLRAGHPVFYSKALTSAVEYWGLPLGGETWDDAAGIRYRSRRDMIEMVMWPKFHEVHPYKKQAMKKTLAFPVSVKFITGSIKFLVGLTLVLFGLAIS